MIRVVGSVVGLTVEVSMSRGGRWRKVSFGGSRLCGSGCLEVVGGRREPNGWVHARRPMHGDGGVLNLNNLG